MRLFSLSLTAPTYMYTYIGLISLGLREPNTFWPGFTFPGPNSYKLYWARFAEPHIINIYRIRFPWPSGPKHILTWVYFPSAWFIFNLLLVLLSFTEPTYIYICMYVYIYIYIYERTVWGWNIATYFVLSSIFPWPSGPKQILSWVHFPSALLIQNWLGLVSLSLKAPTFI